MAKKYLRRRFDVLDGVRCFYLSPSMEEWDTRGNLTPLFRNVERQMHCGKVIPACFDVLIRREPFRTRQPNLAFMSNPRTEQYWRNHATDQFSLLRNGLWKFCGVASLWQR